MNLSTPKIISLVSAGLILSACATTTGVKPISNGLYTINVSRGGADKVKLRAYQHAQKFCVIQSNEGMVVVKEDQKADPSSKDSSIIDLDFKCSGPIDSAYGKKVLQDIQKDTKK